MRDSADSYDPAFGRVRRARNKRQRKFYQPHDDEATYAKRAWELQRLAGADADDAIDGLPEGDRWSTWDQSTPTERGPKPHPTVAGHRPRGGRLRTRRPQDRKRS